MLTVYLKDRGLETRLTPLVIWIIPFLRVRRYISEGTFLMRHWPFHHADIVQPMLLDLYDTYYLPLQSGLRPVMKSFILALLPGLEEETGEFFDKVGATTTMDLQINAYTIKPGITTS